MENTPNAPQPNTPLPPTQPTAPMPPTYQWHPAPPTPRKKWTKGRVAGAAAIGLVFTMCLGAIVTDGEGTVDASASPSPTHSRYIGGKLPGSEPTPEAAEATEDDGGWFATTPARPESFEKLTEREWKRIAKNPDKHAGKGIIVHGEVTQFDAATGESMFRADVGGRYRQPEYGFVMYETNTVLEGDPGDLEDLVSGDLSPRRLRCSNRCRTTRRSAARPPCPTCTYGTSRSPGRPTDRRQRPPFAMVGAVHRPRRRQPGRRSPTCRDTHQRGVSRTSCGPCSTRRPPWEPLKSYTDCRRSDN